MFLELDGQRHSGARPTALRTLPPTSVSSLVDVKYLSGYLICLCQEKDSHDNVFYIHDFRHRLKRLREVLRIILVER